MKKWLFLLAICCSCLLFGLPIQDRKIDPTALSELAAALNPGTDLIAETQKQWLRKSRQERWEIAELSPSQRISVLD